ncbi:MAG TPA: suppressor of fused domain protein [Chthonomonadaceae bacterium]|nr:suppressor of fused domain protein [Chthonomonadaceae bacterium]
MRSNEEIVLTHFEALFGKEASSFSRIDASLPGMPPLHAIFFHDVPEPGSTTAVTYGLSLADHPDWKYGKPELLICVNTGDEIWGEAVAAIAETFRGECPFRYGDVLSMPGGISSESEMSAFLVFAPSTSASFLSKEQATIQLPDKTVFIVGMYPIYAGEVELIGRIGLEAFWHLEGFDPWDIRRPDLSQTA